MILDSGENRDFQEVEESDLRAIREAVEKAKSATIPQEPMPNSPDLVSGRGWNFKVWGSLFNPRQILAMLALIESLTQVTRDIEKELADPDYRCAVILYLGLWVSRNATRMTLVGRWDPGNTSDRGGGFQTPSDAQAIPMKWDYAEANPYSGFEGQLQWILRFLERESHDSPAPNIFGRTARF